MSTKWKVVPSVCTDQMNLAGWKKRPFYSEETYAVIYEAMLEAAPTQGAPVLIDAEELAGLKRRAEKAEGALRYLRDSVRHAPHLGAVHDCYAYSEANTLLSQIAALAANGEKV